MLSCLCSVAVGFGKLGLASVHVNLCFAAGELTGNMEWLQVLVSHSKAEQGQTSRLMPWVETGPRNGQLLPMKDAYQLAIDAYDILVKEKTLGRVNVPVGKKVGCGPGGRFAPVLKNRTGTRIVESSCCLLHRLL